MAILQLNFERYKKTKNSREEHLRLREDAPKWLKTVETQLHNGDRARYEWITRTMHEVCRAIDAQGSRFDPHWWAQGRTAAIKTSELFMWLAVLYESAFLQQAERQALRWDNYRSLLPAARMVYGRALRMVADAVYEGMQKAAAEGTLRRKSAVQEEAQQ